AGVVGEPLWLTATRRDDVDIRVARDGRGIGDLGTVRREVGIGLQGGRGRQSTGVAARARDHPEVAAILEGHQVVTDAGMAKEARALGNRRGHAQRQHEEGAHERPDGHYGSPADGGENAVYRMYTETARGRFHPRTSATRRSTLPRPSARLH